MQKPSPSAKQRGISGRSRAESLLIALLWVMCFGVPTLAMAQDRQTTPTPTAQTAGTSAQREEPPPKALIEASDTPSAPLGNSEIPEATAATESSVLPPPHGVGQPHWEWIRKTSGELFAGDFHGMRDGVLYFDSDEVGDLQIDWVNIGEFFSRQPVTVVRLDHSSYTGSVLMRDGKTLTVDRDGKRVTMAKSDVLRINPTGDGGELDKWYLKSTLGFNLANATRDQTSLTWLTRIARNDDYTRYTLNYDLSYANATDSSGTQSDTANNQWGLTKLDVFVSKAFYVTAASLNAGYDILQNIRFRATPGAGVGFHILDGGPDFDLEVSGAYQYVHFDSVAAGDAGETHGGGGGYRLYFDWDPVPGLLGLELEHRGFIIYSVNNQDSNLNQSTFRTRAVIEVDLGLIFDLDITGIHDRVVKPVALSDGTVPQADTWTLTVGIGVELGT